MNEPTEIRTEDSLAMKQESGLTLARDPEVVLMEAQRAAQALKQVLDAKSDKVIMNGQQYLEFEDWCTLARFYGLTVKEDGDPELVELPNEVVGFKASAVALDRAGDVRSRATAFCLSDEEKWSSRTKYAWAYCKRSGGHSIEDPGPDEITWEPNPAKPGRSRPKRERIEIGQEKVPLFQLASMAQTRANAKALRNVLSWVVVLAGYKPTPAEELDGTAGKTPQHEAEDERQRLAELNPDRGTLCKEIETLLATAIPGQSLEAKTQKKNLLLEAFGTKSWTAVRGLPEQVLRSGLTRLRETFERARDPWDGPPATA